MNRRIGAALSLHPIAALATGEVLGELLEAVGYAPSLVVLFVSRKHRESFQEIVNATNAILAPQCLIGSLATDVLAGAYETDDESALAGWAFTVGDVTVYGPSAEDFPDSSTSPLLILAASVDDVEKLISRRDPTSGPLIGGVPAASGRFGAQLIVQKNVIDSGVVGVSFEDCDLTPIVSAGSVPIGDPFTVTKSERNVVYDLAFKPALERLTETLRSLPEDQRLRARQGLHLGRIIGTDSPPQTARVQEVLGADRANGALSIDGQIQMGDTVQFHLRDQLSALSDLNRQLEQGFASPVAGALVFSSRHRGRKLFGDGDNDASTVSLFTGAATAGMFCSHEIGPTGESSYVHKRYVVAALLRDRRRAGGEASSPSHA
jgi:small ligand-binding sensory domain FIST